MLEPTNQTYWALILGGSSGIGLATAVKLAHDGYSICVLHRDRRASMEKIEEEFSKIRHSAPHFFSLNLDALNPQEMERAISTLAEKLESTNGVIQTLLHSIASGNLRPVVSIDFENDPGSELGEEDFGRTISAMGTSLLTWVQKIHHRGLFAKDARVFGLTSEGNTLAWTGYAAVSAAKCALESIARSIAVEFAPYGIRCNILQPGVCDTPALRMIPGHETMITNAKSRNPYRRLTLPDDVANLISLLARPEAAWVNGNTIRVDGGEHIGAPL